MARRRWLRYGLVLSCLAIMVAGTAVAVGRTARSPKGTGHHRAVGRPAAWPGPGSNDPVAPHPPDPGGAPGSTALIDVAVATLWVRPGLTRPIDEPSVTNPVDIVRWVSNMAVADKVWLVGKLATQALYGEGVEVLETRGGWTKVVVPDQPSSQDPRGYPGWLPSAQLTYHPARDTGRRAVVSKPSAVLRDDGAGRRPMTVSYNTRLAVLAVAPVWTTVATPEGGRAVVATSDVDVVGPSDPRPTGAELVRTAQMFTGLGYLWAGTSGFGFDCSGFTAAVYAAHGIVIARDAGDQAMAGKPVSPGALEPGDLLFFASEGGRGAIHHVAMYVGRGLVIQSPATGSTIQTVPLGRAGFAGEYWGARRYLPPS